MDATTRAPSPQSPPGAPLEAVDLPQLLRLSGMTKAMLTEVADLTLDDAARARLAQIQHRAVIVIGHGLPQDLAEELDHLSAPPSADPSEGELRLVQAQLVGWLTGLFQAFQIAAVERQLQLTATEAATAPEAIAPTGPSSSGPYL